MYDIILTTFFIFTYQTPTASLINGKQQMANSKMAFAKVNFSRGEKLKR